jgi:flagellar motor switch protein FliN/FliY
VLELGPGAVVTLDRVAGEPVDLILNGECFATGNLVVVGDRLGVRIREILSLPAETVAED